MEKLNLNDRQRKLLLSHGVSFDYNNMSDDDLLELDEKAGELLVYEGLDKDYNDNEKGREYRDIIMKINELDKQIPTYKS